MGVRNHMSPSEFGRRKNHRTDLGWGYAIHEKKKRKCNGWNLKIMAFQMDFPVSRGLIVRWTMLNFGRVSLNPAAWLLTWNPIWTVWGSQGIRRDKVSHPGVYCNGFFNHFKAQISPQSVRNSDLLRLTGPSDQWPHWCFRSFQGPQNHRQGMEVSRSQESAKNQYHCDLYCQLDFLDPPHPHHHQQRRHCLQIVIIISSGFIVIIIIIIIIVKKNHQNNDKVHHDSSKTFGSIIREPSPKSHKSHATYPWHRPWFSEVIDCHVGQEIPELTWQQQTAGPRCVPQAETCCFFTNFAPQPICYHDVNQVLSKGFFHLKRFLQRSLLWSLEDFPLHCCGKTTCKSLPSLKLTKMPRENRQFPPKGKVIGQTSIFRFYFSFRLGKFLKPIKLSSTILYNIMTLRLRSASCPPVRFQADMVSHGVTFCHMVFTGARLDRKTPPVHGCKLLIPFVFSSPTKGKLKHKCRIDV